MMIPKEVDIELKRRHLAYTNMLRKTTRDAEDFKREGKAVGNAIGPDRVIPTNVEYSESKG